MVFKNRSGISNFLMIIISVPMIILAGMIGTIGFLEIGDEFIIEDIHNITKEVGQQSGVSSTYLDTIDETKTNFEGTDIPFDLIFSIVLISAFVGSIFLSVKAQPLPTFSFMGVATFGLMFSLLIIVFVDQFITWFVNDFFYLLFNNATTDTPFLNWYFNNLSLISVFWFAILLFLNQVEIDITQVFKRKDTEQQDNLFGGDEQ